MAREISTHSTEETMRFGEELGRGASSGDVFALCGELGSGKTVLAKGVARGLGVGEEITSPSFTLLEIYQGRLPLYHFDLYRIERDSEFDQLGFEEYWEGTGVSVIEWADRAGERLPAGTVRIRLEYAGGTGRRIVIEDPRD
jgi:tRNA threonylcarbamoyladenosine biosynthesis protein TsaE